MVHKCLFVTNLELEKLKLGPCLGTGLLLIDWVFSQVFSNLRLREFCLKSNEPIKSVKTNV